MFPANFSGSWATKCGTALLNAFTFIVFLFLDFLDAVLCVIYRNLDEIFEGKTSSCYCSSKKEKNVGTGQGQVSETLYGRENVFRKLCFFKFAGKWECSKKVGGGGGKGGRLINRWSDCGCQSCISWMKDGEQKLHVVVKEISNENSEDSRGEPAKNVIFLHGFLSSSSFWTKTVFKNLSGPLKGNNYRFFAVDLLGFGRSPKPLDCLYTLRDHVEMIEKFVIDQFHLTSFHLVAHSMGCVIAVALAAKHSHLAKSVTLVAPPYFSASKDGTSSSTVLKTIAGKTLWPPLAFGSSVMSWYEHLGRCVCLVFCRNHRTWERILKLLTRKRDLHVLSEDLSRHTHHSAWHSMHNVICGGAKFMDGYLDTLMKSRVKVCIFHGDKDAAVPLHCSNNMKMKFPDVEFNIIRNAGHGTVILGRGKDFAKSLEHVWALSSDSKCE